MDGTYTVKEIVGYIVPSKQEAVGIFSHFFLHIFSIFEVLCR